MKKSRWTRLLATGSWSVAAVGLYCCTSISGLDDKIFDLGGGGVAGSVATGGDGGSGASTGGGGSGGNGGGLPMLAVPAWSVRLGGTAVEQASAIAVGPSQEIVIAGYYEGELPLPDDCSLGGADAGTTRIFVAKLTGPDACEWSKSFGELDTPLELDVAVNSEGHVFVVGGFSGRIPQGELSASQGDVSNSYDGFYVEYGSDGSQLHPPGIYSGNGTQRLSGVSAGSGGVVFVVGHHELSFDLGGSCAVQTACGTCEDDVIVAQLGPDGGCQHVHGYALDKEEHGNAVAGGSGGTVVFTGLTRGDADFGGGPMPAVDGGDPDIYVAQISFDPYAYHWSHRWGDTADQRGKSVAVDPTTGDVFVTGQLNGQADFDAGLEGFAGGDAFLVRLNSDGGIAYGRAFGAPATDQTGTTVLARPGGAALLGGTFAGTLECSGHDIAAVGTDMFLARFLPDGTAAQCQSFSSSQSFHFADMAARGPQRIVLFGDFVGTMQIGSEVLTSVGTTDDLFLAEVELLPGL